MGGAPLLTSFTTHVRYGYNFTVNILPGGNFRVPSGAWRALRPSDDPYDWLLFKQAKRIFLRDLAVAGLLY